MQSGTALQRKPDLYPTKFAAVRARWRPEGRTRHEFGQFKKISGKSHLMRDRLDRVSGKVTSRCRRSASLPSGDVRGYAQDHVSRLGHVAAGTLKRML
ncbi:hypothetical protein [Burkholderia ubonensis]|uniref:hypothetical protein n=1 Tax=Burkholderia ubonensis TaxID=101571 RepID=UPI000AC9C5FD|nr:hypothetical protein [Burkholderia ubonensis]